MSKTKQVRCNGCGYVGDKEEFSTGRDFFQHEYVSGCPECDNTQNPGDASMRMMPGDSGPPFEYVRPDAPEGVRQVDPGYRRSHRGLEENTGPSV